MEGEGEGEGERGVNDVQVLEAPLYSPRTHHVPLACPTFSKGSGDSEEGELKG